MLLTQRGALMKLAKLLPNGDETLIRDNANYPAPIYVEYDEISPSDDRVSDYAVNADGIYRIDENGYIEQIPIYRVI